MQGELNKNVVKRERERETTSPPFSLLSLQAQMFMVCINYWGLENVPHSGVAVQKPRLITFPFPRSLCLNSLAVNPSRHTSSSDSWETELLLFSNTTQSWPHRTISTAFFKKKTKKKKTQSLPELYFSISYLGSVRTPALILTQQLQRLCFIVVFSRSSLDVTDHLHPFPRSVCLSGGFPLLGSVRSTCGIKPTSMGAIKQTIHGPSLTD